MIPGALEPRRADESPTVAHQEWRSAIQPAATGDDGSGGGVLPDTPAGERPGLIVRAIDRFIALLRTTPRR
ncbi:MAG TPA: hypothetical protein VM032_10895 [Vicinamibacterales bacterium]|nr:hypothetical protein [Vicinamibacterales bacterium]